MEKSSVQGTYSSSEIFMLNLKITCNENWIVELVKKHTLKF